MQARASSRRGNRLWPPASPSGLVTFTVRGIAGKQVSTLLREARIDSIAVPASHAQWDLGARGIASVVRVSPHVYNDDADAAALLERVADIARAGGVR